MPNLNLSLGVMVGLGVLVILMILSMLAKLYNKVGPHEALIVYGDMLFDIALAPLWRIDDAISAV